MKPMTKDLKNKSFGLQRVSVNSELDVRCVRCVRLEYNEHNGSHFFVILREPNFAGHLALTNAFMWAFLALLVKKLIFCQVNGSASR